jgi:hypothetical protein
MKALFTPLLVENLSPADWYTTCASVNTSASENLGLSAAHETAAKNGALQS